MGKLSILFLNGLFLWLPCSCQPAPEKSVSENCVSRQQQDSLMTRFVENGARRFGYNHPNWEIYFDSLIAVCPDMAYAYREKAIPYIKNGDYAKAMLLEDKAVELDPERWTAYRGFLKCIFTKDYEGAIVDFKKAQELQPGNYEMDHTYLFFQGLCNLELGHYQKAEENFKEDIFIQTGGDAGSSIHFNTLFYIGVLYYEMKDYDKAKEYLLKSIKEYKDFPDAHYYLALVYDAEGVHELKTKHLQMAKEALLVGHGISEDNTIYAYYPHQITLYEIEQELGRQE